MAGIRRLNVDEEKILDWSVSDLASQNASFGVQVDVAISMIRLGGVTILSDSGDMRNSHDLTERLLTHFGRRNLEMIALVDEQAKKLGVQQPAFAVRLRSQE